MQLVTADQLQRFRAAMSGPETHFEVAEELVRGQRLAVFRNRSRSARELLERSARFGDRTYLVDTDVRLTFAAHLSLVDAVAVGLQRDHGIGPGDRVALWAANRWEWVVTYWALLSIGAIPVAFNGWWTADEFAHAVDLVEPVLLIADEPRLARSSGVRNELPSLDLSSITSIASAHEGEPTLIPVVDEDDPAVLFFTSGTTGRAKAVTTSHRGLIGFADLVSFSEAMGRVAAGTPIPMVGDLPDPSDDVVLVTSPLFHTSMLNGVVLNSLVAGSSFVLLPGRFDPERVLQAIERERVTRWLALGSAGPRVASSAALGRYDTTSVRYLGVGGAPVSPAVQDAIRAAFPSTGGAMGMGYTSTEGGAVVANIGGPEFLAHPTSTGRPTHTTEIELRDSDGNVVPEGHYGEVHVRSAYLMLGYWNDPDATAAALKPGGWLAMGDIARLQDGLLYIDSRARDMILVSAENVSPTEIEYCLESHPGVTEAAVFAVDDALTGDAVAAAVAVTDGTDVTTEDLGAWCRRQLAHFKVPTRWLITAEPLPRTASGKLVKHELRQRLEAWKADGA